MPHLLDGLADPGVREARSLQIECALMAAQFGDASVMPYLQLLACRKD